MALLLGAVSVDSLAQPAWKAHDLNRPRPPAVTPAPPQLPVPPPSDALVLFDGADLSQWEATDGSPTGWIVEDGAMISVAGAGYIQTKQGFGDVQLHVEWAAPVPPQGESQDRGNSGVFLMGRYEVQVLDSYQNETYADGQAAAVYGQYPPLVNVARPPGQWQSYDIIFRRPRFNEAGGLVQPARLTVLHNGVLVQDCVEPWGPTMWLQALPYQPHPERLPLALQDHGNPVRFRNIWLRELPEAEEAGPPPDAYARAGITLPTDVLDRYTGRYGTYTIRRAGDHLEAHFYGPQSLELVALSPETFVLAHTAGTLDFNLDAEGVPTGVTFRLGGKSYQFRKVE